jgi:hypothetical protein
MSETRILCVLSNARSGSTALRGALAGSGRIKDFGEIFHNDRQLTSFPFLDYLERWPDPLLAMIDWSECSAISQAYVRQLVFESYGHVPLIDIKHNAWNLLRPLWQFPHDEPLFMTALKAERAMFVQLRRENLAEQIISYIIAMDTQIWHAQATERDVPENLRRRRLDPALVRRLCGLFDRAESLTEEFLADYRHRMFLDYETTFANGVLTSEAASRLSAATGIEIAPVALDQKPNLIDKHEMILNYDEVSEIAASVRAKRAAR